MIHVREILLCLFGCAGTKTFVILDLPSVMIICRCLPALKLWQTEESSLFTPFASLTRSRKVRIKLIPDIVITVMYVILENSMS